MPLTRALTLLTSSFFEVDIQEPSHQLVPSADGYTVGTAADNKIVLSCHTVSDYHARIEKGTLFWPVLTLHCNVNVVCSTKALLSY